MAFTCPDCGMTSHNPNDEREGYCGNCHRWTGITTQEERVKLQYPHRGTCDIAHPGQNHNEWAGENFW